MMSTTMFSGALRVSVLIGLLIGCLSSLWAANVYLRVKVLDPPGQQLRLRVTALLRQPNWVVQDDPRDISGNVWSEWISLSDAQKWPLHGRIDREGGIAEWPALRLTVSRVDGKPVEGCEVQVQLADKADAEYVVHDFSERGGADYIDFLCPTPLRDHKAEFETGSQMTARHLQWAMDATGGRAPKLKQFDIITKVWGQYDPLFGDREMQTLKQLGFNVIDGVPVSSLQKYGMRNYIATMSMIPDPGMNATQWEKSDGLYISEQMKTEDGKWTYTHLANVTIWDEMQTLRFDEVPPEKTNAAFRAFLRARGVTDQSLGMPIDQVVFPREAIWAKTFPRDADLTTRKVMYYAAKFGQWWSVKTLNHTNELVKATFKPIEVKTETLPSDHHFFNAWGAPYCGMDATGLDFFEFGAQRPVDILSAEDWTGLNHAFGPDYTWTGGWAYGYFSALLRSSVADRPDMQLRGFLTASDDGFLRLKAYSGLGQGQKSLFFWVYGHTYIATENYWSDLRSMYDGIAKTTRALEKCEDVLVQTVPARDPVAILYSVSHDYWHTDDPASLVENRLTWCALRHLGIQPDFLREEDVENGKLKNYKVLYITGQCLTRNASDAIGAWVKKGGTVYLSGGAATRDEFYTPYVPDFAKSVWPDNAATVFVKEQGHQYNERTDLPEMKPLTTAKVTAGGKSFDMKVLGCRLNLRDNLPAKALLATYADGKPAGAKVRYGKGMVIAVGFLPGLAYSPFKKGQTTLDEVWAAEPRELFRLPLAALKGKQAVKLSVPVVEGSLLQGKQGSALVLVNYTYQPINELKVLVAPSCRFKTATSTEGVTVNVKHTAAGTELTLPLTWTDIIMLK